MRKMTNAVQEIIDGIKTGRVFDAHFVISQIIKHHSDLYIHFAGTNETTNHMHSRIAKMIKRFSVKPLPQQSWSENIHGIPSECSLWEKF